MSKPAFRFCGAGYIRPNQVTQMFENPASDGPSNRGSAKYNLASRLDRFLVRTEPHLFKLHILMLAIFAVVVFGPLLSGNTSKGSEAGAISRVLLWGVWFPLLLLSVVALGRVWCGWLCPMGAASEWVSKIGRHRRIPRWLRWAGLPLASFILISILNEAFGADEKPGLTALMFGSLFLAALTFGFLFERGKRVWCRHACPIGMILGVAARFSPVSLQPKRPMAGREGYAERTICPAKIDLKRKTESQHCIACLRCLTPDSNGGLGIVFRGPCSEIAAVATGNPSLTEVIFLFSSIGISLAVQSEDLPALARLSQACGIGSGALATAFLVTVVATLIVGILSAASAGAARLLSRGNPKTSWRPGFYRIGYSFAPVALAALLFSMGDVAFESLEELGMSGNAVGAIKSVILIGALLGSVSIYRKCGERAAWLPIPKECDGLPESDSPALSKGLVA